MEQPTQEIKHIYFRFVSGFWTKTRVKINILLLLIFILLPWISYENHQAVWLDLSLQQYHFFNLILLPQDLFIFAILIMLAVCTLFFITTYAGRIWCGFFCPHSILMLTFVWIEELCEGNRNKRILLDKRQLDWDKLKRKALKHSIWLGISLFFATTLTTYFAPAKTFYLDFFTLNLNLTTYFLVLFFTTSTYIMAGWMRTIMCLHMCPYARFQSVMIDQNSFGVGYDFIRGEPRGNPNFLDNVGDCIDCKQCIEVCPTGIDIRDGVQYGCINCGACIDVCNSTMIKIGKQAHLISYTTENRLNRTPQKILRPKLIAYGIVSLIMLISLVVFIANISMAQLDVIRDRGQLFRETSNGWIENTFNLRLQNKSPYPLRFNLKLEQLDNYTWTGVKTVDLASKEIITIPVTIAIKTAYRKRTITKIEFIAEASYKNKKIKVEGESRFFNKF